MVVSHHDATHISGRIEHHLYGRNCKRRGVWLGCRVAPNIKTGRFGIFRQRRVGLEERRTARVVLLDSEDRVLLMEISTPTGPEESDPASPGLWVTLGGGVEPGESILAAARRELVEETGLEAATIVRPVWHGRQTLFGTSGERLLDETFVLARVTDSLPEWNSGQWTPEEQQVVQSLRWWTIAELDAQQAIIKPPGLAGLVKDLLADTDTSVREIELRSAR